MGKTEKSPNWKQDKEAKDLAKAGKKIKKGGKK